MKAEHAERRTAGDQVKYYDYKRVLFFLSLSFPPSLFLCPSSTLYVLPSSLHSFPLSLSVSALSLYLLPPPLSLAFAFVLLPASLAAIHCTKLILNWLKGYHNSCSSMPTISLTYFHLNFKPATPTPCTPLPSQALLY